MVFFLVVHFYEDADCLAEHIDTLHLAAEAVAALHLVADLGKGAVQFLVGVRLILETAHQTAADARDLAGIEREILLFCHLDRDRDEVAHPCVAAKRSAADAVAAQDLGLVADADLAQLDPCAENAGEVLDQVGEIHPSVRGKVEQHLTVVESVLGVDQLHIEAMSQDLLLADAVSLFLSGAVVALDLIIL